MEHLLPGAALCPRRHTPTPPASLCRRTIDRHALYPASAQFQNLLLYIEKRPPVPRGERILQSRRVCSLGCLASIERHATPMEVRYWRSPPPPGTLTRVTQNEIRTNHAAFLAAVGRAELKPADVFRELPVEEIFERPAPLDLDLGCGDGSFLVALAQRHPERNILATERMESRVEKVARKLVHHDIGNARILRLESHYVTKHLLPPGCVSVAYVLFPDPWPKRQHHPRRLIQGEFMASLHRVLAPGGELRVKTDDLPYFQWMERVWAEAPGIERIEWPEEPDWPVTDFESQFIAKGMPIHRARLRKVEP